MQSDDDVGKVAAASTHLVGMLTRRFCTLSTAAHIYPPTHATRPTTTAVALEEFLKEIVNGAASVAVSRDSKQMTPAHVKAHVMMEPTLDFCRGVVQRAPDLTEEGADGAVPKPKKERKPREKKPPAKKRKVKSECVEEDEWHTDDETDEEEDHDEGSNGEATATAATATAAVKHQDVGEIKVDLGDLGDLDVDGLVDEGDLEDVGDVDNVAAEEEDYDDF